MKFVLPFKITRRRLLVGCGVFLLLIVVAIIAVTLPLTRISPTASVAVRRGDISASVNSTGKARAKKTARLSLPVSGSVQNISRVEGDDVNMGDVILALRADDASRRVKQVELTLQSRQLDLARAKSSPRDEDIEIARANLRKATLAVAIAEAAYNASSTTQNDAAREIARADLDIARASFNRVTNGPTREELDALQNTVTIAQIDLDNAKTALAQTKLTAPFTSTVTEINVREGELVGGFSPLASVADLSALEIAADIDEIDVANVQVGQTVEVRFDAFPGEKFTGKLTRLFPASSTQRGTTVYSALVDFDARTFKVRPGMGANLKILTVEKKGVLLVPTRALKTTGTRKAVRIVAPGQPRDAIVEVGATDGNDTEIIQGVNEGDLVTLQ